jgi:hypothetical protein
MADSKLSLTWRGHLSQYTGSLMSMHLPPGDPCLCFPMVERRTKPTMI